MHKHELNVFEHTNNKSIKLIKSKLFFKKIEIVNIYINYKRSYN
jgi:hypothetical protein